MTQAEKAVRLAELHQKGTPLVLYNIWDAGGAKALEGAGAAAVATGSWALAAAQGYDDGEAIPLEFALSIVARICASVAVPVSVDVEGGYAAAPDAVAENIRKVLRAGAVGINFEDRVVQGEGLHDIPVQAARIRAIRTIAEEEGVPLVLNARTDLFLGSNPESHAGRMTQAQDRAAAYAEAGASCFFVPGLTDPALIGGLVERTDLPINVMMTGPLQSLQEVTALGVSRASYGPWPFLEYLAALKAAQTTLSA